MASWFARAISIRANQESGAHSPFVEHQVGQDEFLLVSAFESRCLSCSRAQTPKRMMDGVH